MVEIEKPRIECIEKPGDSSYGKCVVEPLEREGMEQRLGTHSAAFYYHRCLEPQ